MWLLNCKVMTLSLQLFPTSRTRRRNPGSRLPASPRWGPLRQGGEVDAERTQGTQPVHGDRPRDRTHSGTGALPRPPRPDVTVLQETGPQPGAELGWHHCRAAAVRWDDGTSVGLLCLVQIPAASRWKCFLGGTSCVLLRLGRVLNVAPSLHTQIYFYHYFLRFKVWRAERKKHFRGQLTNVSLSGLRTAELKTATWGCSSGRTVIGVHRANCMSDCLVMKPDCLWGNTEVEPFLLCCPLNRESWHWAVKRPERQR